MTGAGRTTAFVWLGAILILAALVAAATFQLERQRVQATSRAATIVAEASRAAESSLNRALLRVDSLLVSLPRLLAILGPGEQPDSAAFTEIIRQLNQQSFLTGDVRVHAADGTFLAGARPTPRQRRPRLEPSFLDVLSEDREPGLRFATPSRDHLTGEWSILMGRRIELPSRAVAVAVAEVPLDALADLISAPSGGLPVLLTLRRPDGTVLATTPHRESMIGRPFAPIEPRAATGLARAAPSDVPGRQAIAAARQVSHRPLVLRAAVEEDEALASWSADVDDAVLLLGAAAALLLAGAGGLSFAIRRRQSAQEEVLDARRALQEAIDSMSDGFILFDREQRMVTCNRRYLEVFPYLAGVARPGASAADIAEVAARQSLPGATREEIEAWIRWRLNDEHADKEIEQHVDGRVTHVVQWRTANGGRAWTVRDVTKDKRAEAALVAAKAAAESVGRIRSGFLVNLGRRLHAPLDAIRRAAEPMPDLRGEEILRQTAQLRGLIDEVLDLAKVEAGSYRPVPRHFSLRPLIESCTALACEQAGGGAVELSVQVDDVTVCSDEHALRQILLALLSDAIRASVAARLGVEAHLTRTGMIQLRIAAGGSGSADAIRARGGGSALRGADEGSLAAAASHLAALNGQLEVASPAEGGTVVTVLVPQSQFEAPSPTTAPAHAIAFESPAAAALRRSA